MRRIICLLSVVLVLCVCALPAFASTDGEGQMYYTPIGFDTISGITSTGSIASRFEWLFSFGQLPTADIVYFSLGAGGYGSQIRDGEYYGQINLTSAAGLDGFLNLPIYPKYELRARNVVVRPYSLDGLRVSLFNMPNTVITKCRVVVSAQNIDVSPSTGQLLSNTFENSRTEYPSNSVVEVGKYIHNALKTMPIYNNQVMYLTSVVVEFEVVTEDARKIELRVQCPFDYLATSPPSFATFLRTVYIDLPSDSVNFDVGSFLGNSVGTFMSTPIWGEFTLGHLLGIALTLGVLFFALKLLV